MLRLLFLICLSFCFYLATAQKKISLGVSGNFSFEPKGLGLNDAGVGLQLQSNLFIQQPLQIRVEAGMDKFIGDKLLVVDLSGTVYERNPTIKRIIAGPEIFLHKTFSVAALYGPAWNNFHNNTSTHSVIKLALTGHLGKLNKFTPSFSYLTLPGQGTRYLSVGLGFRII